MQQRTALCNRCGHKSEYTFRRGEVLRGVFFSMCDRCGETTSHEDTGVAVPDHELVRYGRLLIKALSQEQK